MSPKFRTLMILILALSLASGCASPPASPTNTLLAPTAIPFLPTAAPATPIATHPTQMMAVTFQTSDNFKLAGTLFGTGDTAVILAHQGTPDANQTDWHAFGSLLAEKGFTALAFDFRGIGQSEGTEDRDQLETDLAAALAFLRGRGYERIICVGASMGGTTCIRKAFEDEFVGLVALGTGIIVSDDELPQLTIPKLFIAAENDSGLVIDHTTRMYEKSPEPKALHLLPGSEHGTDLFATEAGDELTKILLDFIENNPVTAIDPLPPASQSASEARISFTDSGQELSAAQSWDVALGDLDGDDDLDVFVANASQGGEPNAVWINDGRGTFTLSDQMLGYGQGVELGDVDGDGDLDAVVTGWWGEAHTSIWINDGSSVFADSGQHLGSALRPSLGDLDADGDLDIYLTRMGANSVYLNDGTGIFSDTGQRLGTAITAAVGMADLDGDGDLDVLAGGWDEPAKVWVNEGTGIFSEHEQHLSAAAVHIHDLALGDVDNDGDLDAFMAVASGDPNQVWLNDGTGAFSDSDQPLSSALAHGVSLGDLDGDGDLDAITSHGDPWRDSSGGKIWLNDGSGHFENSGLELGDLYCTASAFGDLDGDGDLDIFITHGDQSNDNGGGIPNLVWLNGMVMSSASTPPPNSGDGMMLHIPGGNFQMGSTDAEIADAIDLCREHYHICNQWYYERESPQHTVSLDDFWIDQAEVTNAQYRLCIEAGICPAPTTCKKGEPTFDEPGKADHPVVCVNWEEAQSYCQWRGSRLPTEAEWEYAFRGADGLIYPWGNEFDGTQLNYCDANCSQSHADERFNDGYALTAPVGSYPQGASWFDVLDMGGNVSEWVTDWYGDYSPDAAASPLGPSTGTEKILKGCSWFSHPAYCRGALRASVDPNTRFDYLGFRCATSVDPEAEGETEMSLIPIEVPLANPPTIDGTHDPAEWDAATVETFADGSELLLMQADGYLYVGIRAIEPGMIAANVFIQSGGEISILHASAALGTAIYKKDADSWQQTQDFTWQCRSTSLGDAAQAERDAFLQAEGWVAANSRMGIPNELEYQIKIPEDDFRLAAAYIKATPPYEKIPWPAELTDDTITPTPGGLPEIFYFSSEKWMILEILQ